MDRIHRNNLDELVKFKSGPCVSLFMPATPAGRDSREDVKRLRGMADEAVEKLIDEQDLRRPEANTLVEPIRALPEDLDTWQHRGQGMAIFAAPGFFRAYHTGCPIDTALYVDQEFHIRPLIGALNDEERFLVLTFSPNAVRLLEGNSESLDEISLNELPHALQSKLSLESLAEGEQVHTGHRGSLGQHVGLFRGQGGKADYMLADEHSFVHVVAQVIDRRLMGDNAPLILATTEENVPKWREALTYKHRLDDFVNGNPDLWSAAELHKKAWPLVQPMVQRRRLMAWQRLQEAAGTKVGFGMKAVVPAAFRGRIDSLFVNPRCCFWGRYNPRDDLVEIHPVRQPGDQDLLELAAIETLRQGGEVFPIPIQSEAEDEAAEALMRF